MATALPVLFEGLGLFVGLLVVCGGVVILSRRLSRARKPPSDVAVGVAWLPHPTGVGSGPDAVGGPSTFPFPPPAPSPVAAGPEGSPPAYVSRLESRALAWRWAGILLGGFAAYVAMTSGTLGRGVLLAAPVFGVCAVGGTLLGELTTLPAAGNVRRAELRVRRVRDYLPTWLSRIVAAGAGVLAVLATVTTAVASRDDMGRPGRYLFCAAGAGAGAWPGSFYTLPVAVTVIAGLVLTGLSLRRVVRRPRPAASADADDALRRRSAEVVTAATGILVLVPLMGIALTAGVALHSLADSCGQGWWSAAGGMLEVVATVAFLGAVLCLAVLLLGPVGPRVKQG